MVQAVNNFFESITNSTNPQYAGTQPVNTQGPSYNEGFMQSQTTPPTIHNGQPYYK